MKIERLGPPDADPSISLALRWRDRLPFAIEPRHHWQDKGDEHPRCLGHVDVI
jgi:hypothetical protein